ncbi:unnamed protein product [Hermetia illucens]|uniref:Uncharacterized protein n=1 Tax=Hermetia illucens TaxID=343691 RepID=A0A7R8V1C8_HERIL|nr:unnamed protein product [Hermetia illucens]
MMGLNPLAVVLVAVTCAILSSEGASLAKIDCTKCRLDVYSFGSKDYDCGISRHNRLPICAVDCKILYDMVIPIPNLNLDFDLHTCVESSAPASSTSTSTTTTTTTAPTTVTPENSATI